MNNIDRDLISLLNRAIGMILNDELSNDEQARLHSFLIGIIPQNDTIHTDMMRYLMLGFYTSQLLQPNIS